jgi:hypothetical protein
MLELEWRLEVLVLSGILILLLVRAADSTRIKTSGTVRILVSGAIGLGTLLSGNALTLATTLPVLLVHTHWGRRGEAERTSDAAEGGVSALACVVVLGLAASASASSGFAWPSHAALLALFALWIAPVIATGGETASRSDSASLFTGGLLPIAIGLKLMAEIVRARAELPGEPWWIAVAAFLAVWAVARSVLRPHAYVNTIATAAASLALLSGSFSAPSSLLGLSWLAAVVLLSGIATQSLVIHRRMDRLWGVPALAMLWLFTLIAAEPILKATEGIPIMAVELAILGLGSAAMGIIVSRPLFAPISPGGADDLLAHTLSRVALALPAVVGIGLGLRGFPAMSLGAWLLALAAVGLSGVALAQERGRGGARRRGGRAFDWFDPSPMAAGLRRVGEVLGKGVRSVMGLLEGVAGILWVWVILLGLLLIQRGPG